MDDERCVGMQYHDYNELREFLERLDPEKTEMSWKPFTEPCVSVAITKFKSTIYLRPKAPYWSVWGLLKRIAESCDVCDSNNELLEWPS